MDGDNLTASLLFLMYSTNGSLNESLNEPTDVSTDDPAQNTEIFFIVSMLTVFCVVGTIGNSLTIYIFFKMRKQKLTSTVFILTLAGTDFLTCSVSIPSTILFEYYHYQVLYDIPCKLYMFLMTTTVPYSSFIMVAIAIDRYLCICHPFLHAMNIKRARIMVVLMGCAIFPFGLIISLFYGVYQPAANATCLVPLANETTLMERYAEAATREGAAAGWFVVNGSSVFYNDTGLFLNQTCTSTKEVTEYTGYCNVNTLIFARYVFKAFQYIHSSFFIIATVIVFVLYGLILKRVLAQNKARAKGGIVSECCRKRKTGEKRLAPTNGEQAVDSMLKPVENDAHNKKRRGSKKGDKMFMANLKIAGTLFTVTFVFCVAFLPSWLMALKIIPVNGRLFYAYFVYNIANPVIYAFLNPSFRQQLGELFRCHKTSAAKRTALTTVSSVV